MRLLSKRHLMSIPTDVPRETIDYIVHDAALELCNSIAPHLKASDLNSAEIAHGRNESTA